MCLAQRENVPAIVTGAVLLDMGADQLLFIATLRRAISWDCLAGEPLPVIKPTSTLANVRTGAIDVSDSHVSPPSKLQALTPGMCRAGLPASGTMPWLGVCCSFSVKQPFRILPHDAASRSVKHSTYKSSDNRYAFHQVYGSL